MLNATVNEFLARAFPFNMGHTLCSLAKHTAHWLSTRRKFNIESEYYIVVEQTSSVPWNCTVTYDFVWTVFTALIVC